MPDKYRDWVSTLAIAAMSLDITSMVLLLLFRLYGTKKKLASWAKPNGRKLNLGMNYQE